MASHSGADVIVLSSDSDNSDDDISVGDEIFIDMSNNYESNEVNPLLLNLKQNDENRRTSDKNMNEKKRREELFNLFKCLHKVLPSATLVHDQRSYVVTKQAILKEALEYISRLKLMEAQFQLSVERELQENFTRRRLIRELQNNNELRNV